MVFQHCQTSEVTLVVEIRETSSRNKHQGNTSLLVKIAGTILAIKPRGIDSSTIKYMNILFRNACRKMHNFSRHRHTEDAISVDRIVKELNEETPSPILFYKAQGVSNPDFPVLAEDTFLLVIMTQFQATLFESFSERIICLDSTHKTNQYRFKLITLVVPDEYRNGNH